jgi:hypothetical protein
VTTRSHGRAAAAIKNDRAPSRAPQ